MGIGYVHNDEKKEKYIVWSNGEWNDMMLLYGGNCTAEAFNISHRPGFYVYKSGSKSYRYYTK
ncbi:MAG: hypothetical protein PHT76_14145 [Anaerostipes sp.]|nr:hypothetical protein [Anaerostipes sp.]